MVLALSATAVAARAADDSRVTFGVGYSAWQESYIETALNQTYPARYYDRDDDMPLDPGELRKRDEVCVGDIRDMSAEQLARCAVRKKYDVPSGDALPGAVLIRVDPAADDVVFEVPGPASEENEKEWTAFVISTMGSVGKPIVQGLCMAWRAQRGANVADPPQVAGCAGVSELVANFVSRGAENLRDGEFRDPHAWGADLLAAVVAGGLAWLWEYKLVGVVQNDGRAFFQAVIAAPIQQMAQGVGRACPGCKKYFGSVYHVFYDAIFQQLPLTGSPTGSPTPTPRGLSALRVMPLGDSITYGVGVQDPEGTGYRARLWNGLADEAVLDFVGSQSSGTLPDKNHEGHPYWRIDQIGQLVECAIPRHRPNVVLLHIGTNDMSYNVDVAGAPARLDALISKIVRLAPETTVLVAQLVPAYNQGTNNQVQAYNAAIPGIVARHRAAGERVRVVDMSAVTRADLTDSVHPNAEGYRKMADAFLGAVKAARTEGIIVDPVAGDAGACTPTTGKAPDSLSDDSTASGTGWRWQGLVAPGVGATRDRVHFADVDGDGLDDYLVLDDQAKVKAWTNAHTLGDGYGWRYRGVVATGVGAVPENVRFADVDGDTLDDYLVLDGTGRVSAWINEYTPAGNFGWSYAGVIATGVGATREQVRFADLSGDGKDDYLVVDDQGRVTAYANEYHGGGTYGWSWMGQVASGVGATRDRVRFADVNGDARDDYLVVHDEAHVNVWLNTVPRVVVQAPGGRPPTIEWQNHGRTLTARGANRDQVRFADVNGDGKEDYLLVDSAGRAAAALNDQYGRPQAWDWQGVVGQNPDTSTSNGMVDLTGDGRADWIAVRSDGTVAAWINRQSQGGGYGWDYAGRITTGVTPGRERVRFADVDGDGKDDYLVLDDNGATRAWINKYAPSSGFGWDYAGVIAPGAGAPKEQVRFADLDGDRKDDYVVLDGDGALKVWLNRRTTGYGWDYAGRIGPGLHTARDEIHLADLNGDFRADYLLVDSAGRVWAWLNHYRDGRFGWWFDGLVASGVGASGSQVRFADLNGDRRADYLVESPNGQIRAWTFHGYVVAQDAPMPEAPTTPDVDVDLDPCALVVANRLPC
ncbi:Lysophospholipase L1 [Micromonospora yangpuensis]|uniref:Lysophospholipase L1 n=1 Tax=Micromonospora yangpuensis TaxID=683228 RepID=A0A1C6UMA3_9ACTN|nr:Lysophospholipase L1 [Micromonospora yangpuensis]